MLCLVISLPPGSLVTNGPFSVCVDLNENGHHRLTCLNAWSEVVELFGGRLGGAVFLEEVSH